MSLTPRSPDEFKPPEIDLGLDLDEKLGEVIAQAKVKAMEEGFNSEYSRGVDLFHLTLGAGDSEYGKAIAQMLKEERRRTIREAFKNAVLFGVTALSVSVAVQLEWKWAIAISIPASGVGIVMARKH